MEVRPEGAGVGTRVEVTRRLLALTLGFLLGLGVASSRPAQSPATAVHEARILADGTTVELPPLPDSIRSMLGWVHVYRVPGPINCGGVPAIGCYTYKTRRLEVATGQSRWNEWLVLRHERIHMILGDAQLRHGVRDNDDPEIDDKIADAIADVDMQAWMAGETVPR